MDTAAAVEVSTVMGQMTALMEIAVLDVQKNEHAYNIVRLYKANISHQCKKVISLDTTLLNSWLLSK